MSRRAGAVLGVGVLFALACAAIWWARGPRAVARRTAALVAERLARGELPADAPAHGRRTVGHVRAFYARRGNRPAWTTGRGPAPAARELLAVLERAPEDGLRPDDYAAPAIARRLEEGGDAVALADLDLLCSTAALRYASDQLDGRVSPAALDAEWHTSPRAEDLDALVDRAVTGGRLADVLASLAPPHAGYRRLKDARARQAAIVAAGGWPMVADGPPLRRGDRGPRVAALAARLAASGDLDAQGAPAATFDATLERAVQAFQRRHGRDPDGVVAAAELAALDVTAEARLGQIDLNMERWRWLPRSFGDRYLLVNIPEYMLHVYEGDRSVLSMRVVVGTAYKPTPVFSDTVTAVIVNPVWDVPRSIVQEELLPALAADHDHLARQGIRIWAGPREHPTEIDPRAIDWRRAAGEAAHWAFRQDPGEHNALGRLKFVMPNAFDVYLHDTPAGRLFRREDRSFSHGCIRLEDPVALATYVLRGRPEGDVQAIQDRIAAGETRTIALPEPLPVHILYFTAFVDDDGTVEFRDDVYGIDRELEEKLAGRGRRVGEHRDRVTRVRSGTPRAVHG